MVLHMSFLTGILRQEMKRKGIQSVEVADFSLNFLSGGVIHFIGGF